MRKPNNQLDLTKVAQLGAVCTLRHLRMATRVITQFYDEILKPVGLRSTQLPVLVAVAVAGPISISHLAEALVMDRTTVTRNLKPLERQGLVRSSSGEDQRTRQVMLTDDGKELLSTTLPLWESAQARIVDTLGQQWQDDLLDNLSVLIPLGIGK